MTKYLEPNNLSLWQSMTKLIHKMYCSTQELTQLQEIFPIKFNYNLLSISCNNR